VADALDPSALERWRRDPAAFISEVMVDPETGKPFVLLDAERRFLDHAYRTNADGRLVHSEQIFSAPKKSGKTAFGAMHALTTTLVYGGPFAEGYVVANDFDQAQGRVFQAARRICERSPYLRREANVTASRIEFPATGASITALASDYASAAGANPTISIFDELWAFTSERSRRLWDEMVPSPARKISCRLTVTHCGFEDESELLRELYDRGIALPTVADDLRSGDRLLFFWTHRPIAPWQDADWLADSRRQFRANQYLRMIENRWTTTESSFVDMAWYDDCVDPDARPLFADKQLEVFVAIDASVKHDSTAIVVVHWDRKINKARVVWHRIFQPSPDRPLDFEATVEATVLELKKRFTIRRVIFDPYQMVASAQRLRAAGVRIEEFPQSVPNITAASQNLYELVKSRNIVFYHHDDVRLAMSRAVAVEGSRGWKISKESKSHKIDVVVALGMAAIGTVRESSARRGEMTVSYAPFGGRVVQIWPEPERKSALAAGRHQIESANSKRGCASFVNYSGA
jgi:phage terminase large subunit-like protein